MWELILVRWTSSSYNHFSNSWEQQAYSLWHMRKIWFFLKPSGQYYWCVPINSGQLWLHSGLCIWYLERTHYNVQCKLWSYNIITDCNIIIVTFDYTTVTMQILYIKRPRKGYEIWLKWSTLHLDHTWLFRVKRTTTVHDANPHGNVWRSVWDICMWLKGLNGGYQANTRLYERRI